jgi:DNA-binding XRE family transcriptional regulator
MEIAAMTQIHGGSPRSLSRLQIQRVLRWHGALTRFRKKQGTLATFSASLGLTVVELRRALQGRYEGLDLSFEQRGQIARWKARRRRFEKRHLSAKQLAEALGVSRSTVFLCIEKQGDYQTLHRSEKPRAEDRSPVRANAVLLQAWGRKVTDRATEAHSETDAVLRKRGAA